MQITAASQLGLVLALGGPFAILTVGRALRLEIFAAAFRLAFWANAIAVLVIMLVWEGQGLASIGLSQPTWSSPGIGILAGIVMLPLFPLIPAVLGRLGIAASNEKTFRAIAGQSFGQRLFLVFTAAVVEEVLYRGYGIERMTLWVHSEWLAALISVVAFTAAHFRWGGSTPRHGVRGRMWFFGAVCLVARSDRLHGRALRHRWRRLPADADDDGAYAGGAYRG